MENKCSHPPKVIILIGAPGSGKGTQGTKIEEEYGFKHISMGDVMRSKKDEDIDNYNKELSSGKKTSLTHELSLRLLKNAMVECGWENGKFVLDGFHRKFDIYDEEFLNQVYIIFVIVFTTKSINILEQRINKRFVENENKESFRKLDMELKEKRLNVYQTETQEIIQYFKNSVGDRVSEINCDDGIEEIFTNIKKILNLKL